MPELQIRESNSTPTQPKLHVSKDDTSFTLYLLQPTPALAPLRHRTSWHLNSSPLAAMHPAREDTSHITAHAPPPSIHHYYYSPEPSSELGTLQAAPPPSSASSHPPGLRGWAMSKMQLYASLLPVPSAASRGSPGWRGFDLNLSLLHLSPCHSFPCPMWLSQGFPFLQKPASLWTGVWGVGFGVGEAR